MPFYTAAEGGADYYVSQYYGGTNDHGGIDFGVYYRFFGVISFSDNHLYPYERIEFFSLEQLLCTDAQYKRAVGRAKHRLCFK